MQDDWPKSSERVQELIRLGAQRVLTPSIEWVEEFNAATLSGERMRSIAEDPSLADQVRQSNLANLLHWATFNIQNPGQRVPPHEGPALLQVARDLVRRGLSESSLDTYRTGLSAAWRRWLEICFSLTSDPTELRELLDISTRSMTTFVEDTIDAIGRRMQSEQHHLVHGTNTERLAAVSLILEGAPIERARAEGQLGYALTGPHTAAIIWGTTSSAQNLEAAADALARACSANSKLIVIASATALWIWLPVANLGRAPVLVPEGVRIAIGRPAHDLDGFRRSHLDATTTQRMIARLTSSQQVAHYEDVALVALMTSDPARADEFVRDTLGDLLTADRETLDTVYTYVTEQFNTSRTAERLYTHRNTIIRRLARAEDLLPRPLAENAIAVAAAVEVHRWTG